jgi:hypothetical protein
MIADTQISHMGSILGKTAPIAWFVEIYELGILLCELLVPGVKHRKYVLYSTTTDMHSEMI